MHTIPFYDVCLFYLLTSSTSSAMANHYDGVYFFFLLLFNTHKNNKCAMPLGEHPNMWDIARWTFRIDVLHIWIRSFSFYFYCSDYMLACDVWAWRWNILALELCISTTSISPGKVMVCLLRYLPRIKWWYELFWFENGTMDLVIFGSVSRSRHDSFPSTIVICKCAKKLYVIELTEQNQFYHTLYY